MRLNSLGYDYYGVQFTQQRVLWLFAPPFPNTMAFAIVTNWSMEPISTQLQFDNFDIWLRAIIPFPLYLQRFTRIVSNCDERLKHAFTTQFPYKYHQMIVKWNVWKSHKFVPSYSSACAVDVSHIRKIYLRFLPFGVYNNNNNSTHTLYSTYDRHR